MTPLVFVPFAVSALACVAAAVLDRFHEKWHRLPHFIYNRAGNAWAVCSVTDFKKTHPESLPALPAGEPRKFRCVPETLAFGSAPDIAGTEQRFFAASGKRLDLIPCGGEGLFHPADQSSELFVPFCAERYGSFGEQLEFFMPAENPEAFVVRKCEENCENDFRLRCADLTRYWQTDIWKRRTILILILTSIVTIVALFLLTMRT
jgi:hypothetical protein